MGRDYAGLRIDLSLLRKCVIVWFPDWLTGRTQVCGRVVGLFAPKYSVPAIKAFRQCLSSLIVPWKTNSRLWKTGSTFSFCGLALGFEP